jgi:hypothetical protein
MTPNPPGHSFTPTGTHYKPSDTTLYIAQSTIFIPRLGTPMGPGLSTKQTTGLNEWLQTKEIVQPGSMGEV